MVLGKWLVVMAMVMAGFSGTANAGDAVAGEPVFDLCTQCHGTAGEGNPSIAAPGIAGLPEWYVAAQLRKFRNGHRGTHPKDAEGMRMRPMALTLGINADPALSGEAKQDAQDKDLDNVAAYVASLPQTKPAASLEGGDSARGQGLYAVCMACHMPDGSGNQGVGSPPLAGASDWYLFSQLKKFKAGIRGNKPEDITGVTMRGMAGTLADEQAMKDVIAYIKTLSK